VWLRTSALLVVLALNGCSERDLWPEEQLDQKTAVNVTIMAEPWIYARDVRMLAANARDYLNLGVVETNRAGTRAYWLGVIAWSTIDRSVLSTSDVAVTPVKARLIWPAGTLELVPASGGRSAVGLSEPVLVDPTAKFTETWYPLSTSQLEQLGAAAPASVAMIDEKGRLSTYEQWNVHAAAMSEFLKAVGL
jgi:hypothetical protein